MLTSQSPLRSDRTYPGLCLHALCALEGPWRACQSATRLRDLDTMSPSAALAVADDEALTKDAPLATLQPPKMERFQNSTKLKSANLYRHYWESSPLGHPHLTTPVVGERPDSSQPHPSLESPLKATRPPPIPPPSRSPSTSPPRPR